MHIPDGGFLSVPMYLTTDALAVGALAISAAKARGELEDRAIPLMGVMGAFVFAAQMINLPIPGGTSGHLMGGTLLAIALGPWTGSLVMAAVLLLQALLFGDGGLLVFGANFLNMGLVGTWGGYAVYRGVRALLPGQAGLYVGTTLAAWLAMVVGAALAGIQIGLSGTAPLGTVTVAMVAIHAIIGAIEAVVTLAVVRYLVATRPELVRWWPRGGGATDPDDAPRPEGAAQEPAR